ncbi:MAG: uroporphyrinogen decarboxylase [Calditrichaeota bacterium]|nr:MAG: uroporphyrinogen decarboxylase [Calditrichota bacterium]
MALENTNFIKACYGKNDGSIPIWIMRQAGRYLPEYLEVRSKATFKELCQSPELIAEVVKQPIDRFNLDAAILFSDILTFLDPLGAEVTFPDKGGPKITDPIETPDDIDKLHKFDIEKELHFALDGIKEIKKVLPNKPLIGFAGSPFTISCYLIEGQGSKSFDKPKKFIHQYPDDSARLFELLADITAEYLSTQIDAGADTVQLFGSWDGILSRDDFYEYTVKPANRIFRKLKDKNVPRIMFVNNLAPYVDLVNEIDCEVVGVDYRMDINYAAKVLTNKSVQGNLDPSILFGSPEHVQEKAVKQLESFENLDRLIFNLGHGIQPKTPIESVETLVKTVQNFR